MDSLKIQVSESCCWRGPPCSLPLVPQELGHPDRRRSLVLSRSRTNVTATRLPELRWVNADKRQNKKHFRRALTLRNACRGKRAPILTQKNGIGLVRM